MKQLSVIIWLPLIVFFSFVPAKENKVKTIHLTGYAQGTTWNITYYHADTAIIQESIDSIFNKIDSSLSLYKPYSSIVSFNKNSRGVVMDEHLRVMIERSLAITDETGGLSDITVGPLTEAWGFGAKQASSVPTDQTISRMLSCVGKQYIAIKHDSLVKLKPCVKLDVNGIAQGYTVDVITEYLLRNKINNFLVEVGGELRVQGKKQPAGEPFRIGIESPAADDFSTPPMQTILSIKSGAVTTSGNYRRFHESKGKKYSHIIDPRTGKSVENEMISATVFAKDATTADAYDNALMVMGVTNALAFIEKRPDMAAFLIYKTDDGKIADTASSKFHDLIQSSEKNN